VLLSTILFRMAFLSPGAGGLPVFGGGFFLILSVFCPLTFSFLRPAVVAGRLMGDFFLMLVVEKGAFDIDVQVEGEAAIAPLLVVKDELRMLAEYTEGRARQRRQFVLAIVLCAAQWMSLRARVK
jgi:hypothetical protein